MRLTPDDHPRGKDEGEDGREQDEERGNERVPADGGHPVRLHRDPHVPGWSRVAARDRPETPRRAQRADGASALGHFG
jgi:hypothetical protein